MFKENGQLTKLNAVIFTSEKQFVAHEKAQRKNLTYKEIQDVKKQAANTWASLTHNQSQPSAVVKVQTMVQDDSLLARGIKNLFGGTPSFRPGSESAIRAIPADYKTDAAQQHYTHIKNREGNERSGPAVDVGRLYAETYFYLASANAERSHKKDDATLDVFISDAQHTLMSLEDSLKWVKPGALSDLNASLETSMNTLRKTDPRLIIGE